MNVATKNQLTLSSWDFKCALYDELQLRCKKNSSYSLRAFSRDLDINHSNLSKIIRGKRKVTSKMVLEVGQKLNMPRRDITKFLYFLSQEGRVYSHLQTKKFVNVNQWYHLAILEMIKLEDFEPSINWISNKLSIELELTQIAVEELIIEGALIIEDDTWIDNWGDTLTAPEERPEDIAKSLRNYQKEILEQSIQAVENVSYEKRQHIGLTVAINPKRLEEAKKLTLEYRKKIDDLFSEDDNCTEVYQFGAFLIPLTGEEK